MSEAGNLSARLGDNLKQLREARGLTQQQLAKIAGVPRASLVVIAATVSGFGIPESGVLLLMGIDSFLDMARSATNVFGNSLATTVIAHWEREEIDVSPDLLPIEPGQASAPAE